MDIFEKRALKNWINKLINSFPFLIGLAVGIIFFALKVTGYSFIHFPGDPGDGRLNIYFLEHAFKYFSGQVESYWDASFMYPEKNVIAYSDNLLGSFPIYAFFRLVGKDIFTSFQWWYVIVSILNYSACYFFLNRLFKNKYAAVLGAFVFAFSIALQSQMTHAQTFPRYAIPLAFWFALKYKEEFEPKYLFGMLFMVVYQIYCGIYIGFMLVIPVGIFILLLVFKKNKIFNINFKNKKWRRKSVLVLAVNLILLLPLMLHYMERSIPPTIRRYRSLVENIPTLKSHFFSHHGSLFWNFLSETGMKYNAWWDHQIFAGGVATLCFFSLICYVGYKLYISKKQKKPLSYNVVFHLVLTGLITFFFFIRFERITAYVFVYLLPGFNSMRAIQRIINIELLFFSISVSYMASIILKNKAIINYLLFFALLSLVTIDNYIPSSRIYRTEKKIMMERTEPIYQLIKGLPEGSLISYEPDDLGKNAAFYQIDAMLISQRLNFKTVNAYTGSSPGEYSFFWRKLDEGSRNQWFEKMNFYPDTLYVVKSPSEYKVLNRQEILEQISKIKEGGKNNQN